MIQIIYTRKDGTKEVRELPDWTTEDAEKFCSMWYNMIRVLQLAGKQDFEISFGGLAEPIIMSAETDFPASLKWSVAEE